MVLSGAALAGLQADGVDVDSPSNAGAIIAIGAAATILGGAFLILASKGSSTCPPGTQATGVPGVCCPNGTAYDASSKTCKSPGGGTCVGCLPPNTCNGSTCVSPVSLTCTPSCQDGYACVYGQCLPILGPPIPFGCAGQCGNLEFCDPSTGQCLLYCAPTCDNPSYPYCDTSLCNQGLYQGCGLCVSHNPDWSFFNVDLLFDNASFVAGQLPHAIFSFDYVGPGGLVQVGWYARSGGIFTDVCQFAFTNQASTELPPANEPVNMVVDFYAEPWPSSCLLCLGFGYPIDFRAEIYYPGGPYLGPFISGEITC